MASHRRKGNSAHRRRQHQSSLLNFTLSVNNQRSNTLDHSSNLSKSLPNCDPFPLRPETNHTRDKREREKGQTKFRSRSRAPNHPTTVILSKETEGDGRVRTSPPSSGSAEQGQSDGAPPPPPPSSLPSETPLSLSLAFSPYPWQTVWYYLQSRGFMQPTTWAVVAHRSMWWRPLTQSSSFCFLLHYFSLLFVSWNPLFLSEPSMQQLNFPFYFRLTKHHFTKP